MGNEIYPNYSAPQGPGTYKVKSSLGEENAQEVKTSPQKQAQNPALTKLQIEVANIIAKASKGINADLSVEATIDREGKLTFNVSTTKPEKYGQAVKTLKDKLTIPPKTISLTTDLIEAFKVKSESGGMIVESYGKSITLPFKLSKNLSKP